MKVIIIGGVAGGAGTAARLRRNDENAEIIMFEKGEFISFANCGLPYYIGDVITNKSALQLQTPKGFSERFDIDVRIKNEVISVDTSSKTVTVKQLDLDKIYTETYDVLVISPGASPIRPPIKDIEKNNVFTLRNIPDTYAIKEHIEQHKPKTAAVIGGGFIGVEMAENLHALGIHVSIIEAQNHIMTTMDSDMTYDLHNHIRSKGVSLYLDSLATEFTENSVILKNGTSVPADMVILSIGVSPETKFLKGSGIELGSRGEILVDDHLRTNINDVYALGDAVSVKNIVTNQVSVVPLASPANRQARIVADIISGKNCRYSGAQGTAIAKIFDMTAASTGASEKALQTLGIKYHKTFTFSSSHAGYYPGGCSMMIKLLYSPKGIVLGGQIVGYDGVDKRIDQIATAVRHNFTVYDLQELELAYAPPFSSAKDPVNIAGYTASNVLEGHFHPFFIEDIENLPNNAQLIDVRTKEEYSRSTIGNAVNIPLDDLRNRINEIDKNKKVYIFCQVGLRGYLAERILSQKGFDVENLSGGYRLYESYMNDKNSNVVPNCIYEYCGKIKS